MSFENVEQINDHYKKTLAGVDEEAAPQVQLEWDRAKLEFERNQWQAERHAVERSAAIEDAIKKHPSLKGLEDYIRGESANEIKQSAQRLADKMGGPKKDEAREAYGPSTGVVGRPISVDYDDARDRFHRISREINAGRRLKEDDARFYVAAGGGNALANIRRALRYGANGRG